jgi:glutathione S-transferase
MPWKYGCDDAAAVARAPTRANEILDLLADQLKRQQDAGRRYLVGTRLSAVDIYWATFSNLLAPLPPEQSPMLDYMRKVYATWDTAPGAKPVDPALLAHRDFVFAEHIGLPQEF